VPFEEASAAQREEGVPDEGHPDVGCVVGDWPEGVTRRAQHVEGGGAEGDCVASRTVRSISPMRSASAAGATIWAPVAALTRALPADVVGVPVGVEDQGDRPAEAVGLAQDGVRVGRVHAGDQPAVLVAGEEAVVVGEAGEEADVERHRDFVEEGNALVLRQARDEG
jgi:hypothetical protein